MKYKNFMPYALDMAKLAFERGEVPVGAVIVKDGEIIASAHNETESSNNASHHAEILAIERACRKLNNKYLTDCDLFVTLEPCAMCAGAVINHTPEVYFGFSADECSRLLKDFFAQKR